MTVKAGKVDFLSKESYILSKTSNLDSTWRHPVKAKLTTKGQVTVPKPCRDKLGLKTGTVLEFEAVGGVLIARKVQAEDAFRKWRGRGNLPKGQDVDSYLSEVRG
jgi:antitoxin PrlF